MLDVNACEFVSPEVFSPVTGGWAVANRVRSTIVCAGAAGGDESIGRFVLLRDNDRWGTQRLTHVDVPSSGSVTITDAPLGRRVVGSAQRHGVLSFTGSRGLTGRLHLNGDRVVLEGS